jgi:hypothetical protein
MILTNYIFVTNRRRCAISSKQAHSCNYTPQPTPFYFAICQLFSTKMLMADQDFEPHATRRNPTLTGNFKVGITWLTIG